MSQKITAPKLMKLGFHEILMEWVDYPGQHVICYTIEIPKHNISLHTEYHAWADDGYWVKCYERDEIHITDMWVLENFLKRHS